MRFSASFLAVCPEDRSVSNPVPAPDHTCPVAFGAGHGLLTGSPVNEQWCLSYQRQALLALPTNDIRVPELLLWKERDLAVYYAPWDWVNTEAKVMRALVKTCGKAFQQVGEMSYAAAPS